MPSLREWAERWTIVQDSWKFERDSITLDFGENTPALTFGSQQVQRWQGYDLPEHSQLTHVADCGVETDGYAEYLVDLDHIGQWPRDEPLRFRIGSTLVQLGSISPALALILEPYYKVPYNYQREFAEHLSSISVFASSSPRDDALQALFYLNADYLAPSKASARIFHLLNPGDIEDAPEFDIVSAGRKRIRKRPRIQSTAPVKLFLAAASDYSEFRFLSHYRVLEFYFSRARQTEFSRARKDPSVADAELFKRVKDERGELPQLLSVVRSALTSAEASAVMRYVTRHGLAACKSLNEVASALYAHRNALVHAKEDELARSRVPDPFDPSNHSHGWEWIAEYLAIRCIRRL